MIYYFQTDANGFITNRGQCVNESELPSGEIHLFEAPINATHYINEEFDTKPNEDWIKIQALGKRQALLIDSDWTQLPDVAVDKAAWAAYRQHLRDIPSQAGFPITIDWGTAPNSEE